MPSAAVRFCKVESDSLTTTTGVPLQRKGVLFQSFQSSFMRPSFMLPHDGDQAAWCSWRGEDEAKNYL